MEVGALPGHEFDFQAMLDRRDHPARGRRGGGPGAATEIARSDGSAMAVKGKQFVPEGAHVVMAFPGGGGYGDPAARDPALVRRDLARGYIDAATARDVYGLPQSEIDEALDAARRGMDP
jgi:N-methylhydantoinase B